jgi:transcriptional regulator with XRE-family HTH domain
LKTSGEQPAKTFGQRVRELRRAKNLGQRALAAKVGVSFTYVSRIENENLDFGPYPSDALIGKLAAALEADEDELLILAKKIPEGIRRRVLERPEAFRKFAALDDAALDLLVADADRYSRSSEAGPKRKPKVPPNRPSV